MQLTWNQLLSEINKLFIRITRDKIFRNESDEFLEHVQNCLKLANKNDWNYILASEDILEDSNEAISNFLRFGMSGPTKYDDIGEKYLRLYGVLNAAYLQQQAVLNIFKFIQCDGLKKKRREISNLQVTELRHKLAAHSANFDDPSGDLMQVYVPVRFELYDFECSYFNHLTDKNVKADLAEALENHLKFMCETYLQAVKQAIATIYKCNADKQKQLLGMVSPFDKMLGGCGLIKNEATGEYVVVSYVEAKKI